MLSHKENNLFIITEHVNINITSLYRKIILLDWLPIDYLCILFIVVIYSNEFMSEMHNYKKKTVLSMTS